MYMVLGVMSNQLSTPKIVVCPADERTYATNFAFFNAIPAGPFRNLTVSSFVGRDADETLPLMFLAGDRNIYGISGTTPTAANVGYGFSTPNGNTVFDTGAGLCAALTTNASANVGFTAKMHAGAGNIVLSDGSVQQLTSSRLKSSLPLTQDPTIAPANVLYFP